jgi:hypothetical protein
VGFTADKKLLRLISTALAPFGASHQITLFWGEHTLQIEEPLWYGRVKVHYDDELMPMSVHPIRIMAPAWSRDNKVVLSEFTTEEDGELTEYHIRINGQEIQVRRNGQWLFHRY